MNAEFKNYYTFPLKIEEPYDIKVFTADHSMAIDYPFAMLHSADQAFYLDSEVKAKILDQLNGVTDDFRMENLLIYDPEDTSIYLEVAGMKLLFMIVRGWGNLTGHGDGHGLPDKKASEIQDAFAAYIIKRLRTEKDG